MVLLVHPTYAQQTVHLSGHVLDENGNSMPGVLLHIGPGDRHVTTGNQGRFSVYGLLPGMVTIHAHFIGYEIYSDTIEMDKDIKNFTIKMVPVAYDLDGVVISENPENRAKREQTLEVKLVDRKFISGNLGGDMMKTLSRLPGISSIDIGSGQSKPVIRGLAFNRVVVSESGIKHEGQQWGADHGLEIDQFNVAKVEVLKGPASLMYGSDAIGGVIKIEPYEVPADNGTSGNVALNLNSNNNLIGISASTTVRKNNRFFYARITGISNGDSRVPIDTVTYNTYDFVLKNHYLRNTAGRELNGFISGGFTGKWGITKLSVGNFYQKAGFYADAHGFEIRNSKINYDASNRDIDLPYQEVNHFKTSSNTTIFLNDQKLDINLGFQNNRRREYAEPTEHGYRPMPPNTLEREFNKNILTANVLMQHIFSERHSMNSGVDAEYQDNRIGGWGFIIPAFRQITAGAFIFDRLKLTDRLTMNTGLRFDAGNIHLDAYHDWYPTPVFDADGNIIDETFKQRSPALAETFTSITGSVGANYSTDHFTGRLNLGNSFRLPDARELGADGVNYHLFREERGDSTLTPERAWQADLSLDYDRGISRFNVSGFYSWFPGYIYLNPTSEFSEETGLQVFNFVQNKVMRFGGELEWTLQFTEQWSAGIGAEYVYSEQMSGDKKGFGLAFSPPSSATGSFTWMPYLLSEKISGMYFTIEAKVAGRQGRVVPPEEPTGGYHVFNFLAGTNWSPGKQDLEISLQVKNLLNTTYFNHTSFYRLINIPEPGRRVQLTVRWKFGKARAD